MSLFKDLISSIDPAASGTSSAAPSVPRLASGSPKPIQRPAAAASGTPEMPGLKRKASGPMDGAQVKIQKKDAPAQPGQANGTVRTAPPAGVAKPNHTAASIPVPYRGTAGLGTSKPANAPLKKPILQGSTPASVPKAAVPAPRPNISKPAASTLGSTATKPAAVASGSAATASQKKTGGYLAMLQKAKQKEQTKPPAPPIKHEPTKILSKKEREKIRLEAKAAGRAKKSGVGAPAKSIDGKADAGKEKRKPAEIGYQGTARPTKKPVDIGYKGTAKPMTAAPPSGKAGAAATKAKAKMGQSRYSGYAEWSDLDEMDDEEDYESDASSDMEGGFYDVEDEEQMALKLAKKEDAEALAEEMALKREKEERKRRLEAMNKAAAGKRKY